MAFTFPKQRLSCVRLDQPNMAPYVREHDEGVSETFVTGAPVVITAGLIVEGASPATDIYGFSVRAGQNLAAPTRRAEFIPVVDGLEFFANFLGAAGADNVIAAADYSVAAGRDLEKANILPGAVEAWYVLDAAVAASVRMTSDRSDYTRNAGEENPGTARVVVGDTNARPTFVVLASVRSWN